MRTLVLFLLGVLLAVAACAPSVVQSPAPGVLVTLTDDDDSATLTVMSARELPRLFLRLPGVLLAGPTAACADVAGAVECVARSVSSLEVVVVGSLSLDPALPVGVACFDEACSEAFEVYLP